jgi:subtilisin-like proprotein convertase family protein
MRCIRDVKAYRRPLHFEQLEERTLLSITGDYDGSGAVDAADYVVWRKTLGTNYVMADGNGSGMVDPLDYDVWQEHFRETVPPPGEFQITGPEHLLLDDDFTIEWEAAGGATSYVLSLSDNQDGSDPFYTETLTTNWRQFFGFSSGSVYALVKAVNAGGETFASNGPYDIAIHIISPHQTLFVTSVPYFIDPLNNYPPAFNEFGSTQVADYGVTNLAAQAGLLDEPWDGHTIYFRAMISEALLDLTTSGGLFDEPFFNTRSEVIAWDIDDLFDGSHLAPIYDQNGNAVVSGNLNVWTGANADGSSSGLTASDWTTTSGTATVGRVNGTASEWISFGTRASNLSARLYGVGDVTNLVIGQPSLDVPKFIIDNSTITSQLTIGSAATITDVDIQLTIAHHSTADLSAFLISPNGTRVELFSNEGGETGRNFDSTIFNDETANSVTTADAPFLGNLRPAGLLSAFDGENPNGVWTLEITDDETAVQGVLRSWSLRFNSPISGGGSGAE